MSDGNAKAGCTASGFVTRSVIRQGSTACSELNRLDVIVDARAARIDGWLQGSILATAPPVPASAQ